MLNIAAKQFQRLRHALQFKSKTVDTDKPALKGVSERSGALLPTTSQLDENIRVAMQKTAENLGELAKTQNAAKETAKANGSSKYPKVKLCLTIPSWCTLVLCCSVDRLGSCHSRYGN